MTTFEKIKTLAKMQGLSLTQLNDKAGLGKNSIYHWKTKQPNIENLQKVAKILHVSVDQLLEHENSPSNQPVAIDIAPAIKTSDTMLLSYEGKEIPAEELEMIRRILEGGKNNNE
ncbi:XRE family transcriptional regulator [Bombilactobacillus bombi]|jgi:transcriptional regulator with XRE-family HTH domain|uniref:XRE family transcriptional regulator n=1 Tax=Bombilactobacillus bombi TaxID=1303590 RepID=A0A347SQU1_9LACO|nr:helix-turn-helix transcriptional regulator [Bombilactobacillus bombi]AXX64400.1 XRE family transcriptional regulator [Bombilactobacillus bombi]RHW49751.1 XRE family transcriptional regulator [Bombilactobacillus bombi]